MILFGKRPAWMGTDDGYGSGQYGLDLDGDGYGIDNCYDRGVGTGDPGTYGVQSLRGHGTGLINHVYLYGVFW